MASLLLHSHARNHGWCWLALGAALAMGSVGCGTQAIANHAAKGATEGVAEDATGQKGPNATRALLGAMLDDPKVKQAARDLARASVMGAMDGLTEDQVRDRTGALVAATMKRLAPSEVDDDGGETVQRRSQLQVVLQTVVGDSVRAAVNQVRASAKEDSPEITEEIVGATTHAMMRSMAEAAASMDGASEGGPATFPRVLSREVTRGIGDGLKTVDHEVMVATLHDAGMGLGAGVAEGLPKGLGNVRGPMIAVAIALSAVFALGLAFLVSMWRQQQLLAKALTALIEERTASRHEERAPRANGPAPTSRPSLA